MDNAKSLEFRRGWPTLAACATGNGFGLSGLAFYTFGVFVVPLVNAFGWSRGDVSVAASFLLIGTAFTAPIIGTVIDRFGAKRVCLISMTLLSVGYALLTQLGGNIAMFYAMWLAMSLIGGGTTPVVWTRAINLWFDKGRGLALGLCLAGSGLSGIFGPPLCTKLIQTYGWQGGYIGVGAMILLVAVPLIALLFNDHAPHHDTVRHVAMPTAAAAAPPPPLRAGMDFHASYRTAVFWKIAIGFFFVGSIIAGLIINLVPLLIDRGLSAMAAAEVAGVLGIAVLVGRIGTGYLLDRFHGPAVARVVFIVTGAGCFLLTLGGAPNWLALVAVIALGLAAAAEIDMVAYFTSRYFGMKSYGKIYGIQLTVFYIGAAIGPLVVGQAYDLFGSYLESLYAAVIILIGGAFVLGSLGPMPDFGEGRGSH
ncbi:MAG: MFS transporter [Rhodospirillaceae bacterium]|nr:MFS transporter [Rhodospirillaceae bacterium]